jgi:hypothetical protein
LRTLKVNDGTTDKELAISAGKLHLDLWNGSASALQRWGSLVYVSGLRTLKVNDGSAYQALKIAPDRLTVESQAGSGALFEVLNAAPSPRFVVYQSGNDVDFHGKTLTISDDVDLSSMGGENMAPTPSLNAKASPLLLHYFDIPTRGSSGSTDYEIQVSAKVKVIDVLVIKTDNNGTLGDWVEVRNEDGNLISNQIAINIPDQRTRRAMDIDDTYSTVDSPGGKIVVRAYQDVGGDMACDVYVMCTRVS